MRLALLTILVVLTVGVQLNREYKWDLLSGVYGFCDIVHQGANTAWYNGDDQGDLCDLLTDACLQSKSYNETTCEEVWMVLMWQIQWICPNPVANAAQCETWLTNLAQKNYDFVWDHVEPWLINAGFITVGAAAIAGPANAWCVYPDADGFVTY